MAVGGGGKRRGRAGVGDDVGGCGGGAGAGGGPADGGGGDAGGDAGGGKCAAPPLQLHTRRP